MGKGRRTRVNTEQSRILEQEKAQIAKRKKQKQRMITMIVSLSLVAFIVVSVLGTIAYTSAQKNGVFLRNKTVMKTENFKINGSMAQYFFNSNIKSYTQNYSEYLDQLGLDTTADLKEQASYDDANVSWYDYFLESTQQQMKEILLLSEKAKKEGYTLSQADYKAIDTTIASLTEAAESDDLTLREFLDANYGTKVSEEDIRDYLEITTLAQKYFIEYTNEREYKSNEISDYFDENKANYLTADYMYYLVNVDSENKNDAEIKILESEAKATAKELAKADSKSEFEEKISEHMRKVIKQSNSEMTEDEIEESIESAIDSYTVSGEQYDVSTELGKWLFSEERKAADSTVVKGEENEGYYAVYLVNPAKKDTSDTRSFRHILFNVSDYEDEAACEKAANKVLKEWRNGDKTEQSFSDLAKTHSDDIGSASVGGLYKNYSKGGYLGETFEAWLFAKNRKAGEVDVIKGDDAWHVVYYVGEGLKAWESNVVGDMQNDDYSKLLEDLGEKIEVKVNESKLELLEYIPEPDTGETETEDQSVSIG